MFIWFIIDYNWQILHSTAVEFGTKNLQLKFSSILFLFFSFGLAAGGLYVRHFPIYQAKETVAEIVGHLKDVFKMKLNNLHWMHQDTKTEALKKLEAMTEFLLYPEEILDNQKLENFYQKLNFEVRHFEVRKQVNSRGGL